MYSSLESRCLRFVLFDFLLRVYIFCSVIICFISTHMRGGEDLFLRGPFCSLCCSVFQKVAYRIKVPCDIFLLVLAYFCLSAPVQPCLVRHVDRRHQCATKLIERTVVPVGTTLR